MDLALHLGMTEGGLKRAMTERELLRWQRYAAKRMLPMRRIELHLARIALTVAQSMGGASDLTLADFLFDPKELDSNDPDDFEPEEIAAFFGAQLVEG